MNWNDLQYFVQLVDTHTLTATAEKLNVQHTTVARRIEKLEQALNLKLFDRLGKRYTLTAEGQLLYAQACEVAASIHTLSHIANEQNSLHGKVIVSAPPVLANEFLLSQLRGFYQQYPEITLSLQGEVHRSDLYQREADIALRIGRPTQEGLVIRKLADINYCFYANPNTLKRLVKETSWPLIEFQANPKLLTWSKQLQQVKSTHLVFSSNDMYLAKNAIKEGFGIGILGQFLAEANGLIALNPNNGEKLTDTDSGSIPTRKTYELYLVMHPDVRRSPRVRVVADWLISVFDQHF